MKYTAVNRNCLTQESFIARANETHNNRYDYTKTVFVNIQSKVTVTCRKHGDFSAKASHHLYSKQGCRQCFFESRTLTTDGFISKAKEVHGDKYDYTKTVYLKAVNKLTITCYEHGDFLMKPGNHLQGGGCPQCGRIRTIEGRKSSTEEFISNAKRVHGDLYDYSKVNYINSRTLVTIICSVHQEFTQTPNDHLAGSKCQECSKENRILNHHNRLTQDEFINRSKEIHGDKYDYSQVKYTTDRVKVNIICPIHGKFTQSPSKHIRGQGCRQCNKKILTTEEFISKARKAHGDAYDYSKTVYISKRSKIIIICKKHGEILVTPPTHLLGVGCPSCSSSKGELLIKNILDKRNIKVEQQYRIPNIVNRIHYDFYLPEYNILIEFHGKQHYEYIPHFHRNSEDGFLKQKNRDDIARYNAKHYKYNYLEFNYKQLKHMTVEDFETMVINKITKFRRLKE
jgi:hypothetical protein